LRLVRLRHTHRMTSCVSSLFVLCVIAPPNVRVSACAYSTHALSEPSMLQRLPTSHGRVSHMFEYTVLGRAQAGGELRVMCRITLRDSFGIAAYVAAPSSSWRAKRMHLAREHRGCAVICRRVASQRGHAPCQPSSVRARPCGGSAVDRRGTAQEGGVAGCGYSADQCHSS